MAIADNELKMAGALAAQYVTKSEYAYSEIRRRILSGELAPGARLPLRALADELELSVMPVRDALRMLERDHLVTSANHRGASVAAISKGTLIDLLSARMWMEVLAVREAALSTTPDGLQEIERELENSAEVVDVEDGYTYAQANRSFHEAVERSASDVTKGVVAELWERTWEARRRVSIFVLVPDTRAQAQREHERIVEAMRIGDPDAAADAMLNHRESTLAAWADALAELSEN